MLMLRFLEHVEIEMETEEATPQRSVEARLDTYKVRTRWARNSS